MLQSTWRQRRLCLSTIVRPRIVVRALRQWLLVLALLGAVLGYPLWSEVHYAGQIVPNGIAAVPDFFRRFGEPRSVQKLRKDGQSYYELRGPLPSRWILAIPSSPPAYVFDETGRYVTWCRDPGDMPKYRVQWPLESTNYVDIKFLKQKFGM